MSAAEAAIAWDAPSPHVLPLTVREEHIDLMRHVNNVHYLQWLEDVASGQFIWRKVTPLEVEVHGDVAVTFARLDVVRREGAGEDRYALKYVRVYARRGGRWRLLSHRTVQMLTP